MARKGRGLELLEATLWIPTLAPLRRGFLFLPAGLLLGFPLVHSSASERGYPTQLRFPTPYSRAPSRFAKRPERRVPHSQPIRYRQRCNADRSGFCLDSAFGSKFARSMPLSPRTKGQLRRRSKQPRTPCCGDQAARAQATLHRKLRPLPFMSRRARVQLAL